MPGRPRGSQSDWKQLKQFQVQKKSTSRKENCAHVSGFSALAVVEEAFMFDIFKLPQVEFEFSQN